MSQPREYPDLWEDLFKLILSAYATKNVTNYEIVVAAVSRLTDVAYKEMVSQRQTQAALTTRSLKGEKK
jgi:hypothetical protein